MDRVAPWAARLQGPRAGGRGALLFAGRAGAMTTSSESSESPSSQCADEGGDSAERNQGGGHPTALPGRKRGRTDRPNRFTPPWPLPSPPRHPSLSAQLRTLAFPTRKRRATSLAGTGTGRLSVGAPEHPAAGPAGGGGRCCARATSLLLSIAHRGGGRTTQQPPGLPSCVPPAHRSGHPRRGAGTQVTGVEGGPHREGSRALLRGNGGEMRGALAASASFWDSRGNDHRSGNL